MPLLSRLRKPVGAGGVFAACVGMGVAGMGTDGAAAACGNAGGIRGMVWGTDSGPGKPRVPMKDGIPRRAADASVGVSGAWSGCGGCGRNDCGRLVGPLMSWNCTGLAPGARGV